MHQELKPLFQPLAVINTVLQKLAASSRDELFAILREIADDEYFVNDEHEKPSEKTRTHTSVFECWAEMETTHVLFYGEDAGAVLDRIMTEVEIAEPTLADEIRLVLPV